jgi:hypothetical protein
MTKKEDAPRPLFPTKHEFYKSLDRFVDEAGLLANLMRSFLIHGLIDAKVRDLAQERLDAFDKAKHE